MEAPTKKPNIKLPEGMELVWNSVTGRWAMRPVPGYSTIYLDKNSFIPKSTEERKEANKDKCAGKTKNGKLHKAKRDKNDEFYTRLEDITDELKHYGREFFEGKVVYCPCDKAFNLGRSNFFTFFTSHFLDWGLKKLVATQYVEGGRGWMWVIEKGDINGNGYIDESEIDTYQLTGNGDFLSEECRKIMDESDVVVTNPPFSLFRPFVNQLVELNKKFLIIGNQNAITYKEIFPLIKENKVWLGYHNNATYIFESPNGNILESNREYVKAHGLDPDKYIKVPSVCWFTNLEHNKRKEDLYLGNTYFGHESEYPKYDNYNAIEVSKVANIPVDYNGVMGVPITFLGQYNPEQFEIVGCADADILPDGWSGMTSEFVELYYKQGNTGQYKEGNRLTHYVSPEGKAIVPFKRILIRRKK